MPTRPGSHKPSHAVTLKHAVDRPTWGGDMGGRPWRRKRKAIMERDNYLCQPCCRAGRVAHAQEVDHIINRAQGGTDDDSNLEAICIPCHKTKTADEARRGRHS